ncbi:MAG: GDSL-type esterase/lipase family protein [Paludibacteraceae bacterium]
MKPSRIAILIWCAIALLGVMCLVLPERMQIGPLTLRWTTLNKVLGSQDEGFPLDEGLRMKDEGLDSTAFMEVRSPGRTQYNADLEPNGAAGRPHLLDTSETKVISPSSCVLPPLSQESPSSCVLHPSSVEEEVQGDSDVLTAFRQGLAEADRRTVRVVHYGDSQIEEDRMTQTLRRRLQAVYGGGGVGMLPLQQTIPTRTIKQTLTVNGIRQTTQQGPRRHLVYGPKAQRRDNGLYGPMGQVALLGDTTLQRQDSAVLHVEPMGKKPYSETYFNRARVWAAGDFRCYVNGQPIPTGGAVSRPHHEGDRLTLVRSGDRTSYVLADSTTSCDLALVGCGEVYAVSLETERGVIVDNIPMRGCTGTIFTDIDSTQLATFYRETNTRLIIMQFGGNAIPFNEQPTTIAGTVQSLRKQVRYLRRCAPEASILFVGPGDMLTQIDGETTTYPLLPYMDRLLRKMAAEEHIAYFSLYEMMGGKDSMLRWQKNGWAGSDGVHFTRRGAEIAGEKLSEYIMKNL